MFDLQRYELRQAGITSSVIALGVAGSQIIGANKAKREAKGDIENFDPQELKNPYENITIDTLASEQQTQANLSNSATAIDALQRGGVRAISAGVPQVTESNILLQNIISEDLARQAKERSILIAKGDENNQRIIEDRENLALQGLGQQYQVARQDEASGATNLVSGLLAFDSAIRSDNGGKSGFGTENTSAGTNTGTTTETSVSNVGFGQKHSNIIPTNPLGIFNEKPAFEVKRTPTVIEDDNLFDSIFGRDTNTRPSFF